LLRLFIYVFWFRCLAYLLVYWVEIRECRTVTGRIDDVVDLYPL